MTAKQAANKRHFEEKLRIVRAWKALFGCRDCGERDPVVLDLHHRDPDTKAAYLRKRGGSRSLIHMGYVALVFEFDKCDVLCANCHRREEHRRR